MLIAEYVSLESKIPWSLVLNICLTFNKTLNQLVTYYLLTVKCKNKQT